MSKAEGKQPEISRWLLLGLVVLAAALQASRLPFRWNAISLAYASYFKEYRHAVELGGWDAALTTFVGLHPPGYSLIFLAFMAVGVAPLTWHALSGLFSVAAIPCVWRAARCGWGQAGAATLAATAVLAVSPHRNAYGLEPNNYPMLVLVSALQLAAFAAWVRQEPTGGRPRRCDLAFGAATVLALYTHVLAITLPAAQLLTLLLLPEGRQRLRRFAAVQGLATLPCAILLPTILQGGGSEPMNNVVGLQGGLEAALLGFPFRYGSTLGTCCMALVFVAGAWGVLRSRSLVPLSWLLHAILATGLIVWMVSQGIAADHQFPYYLVVLPSGALVAGSVLRPSGEGSAVPRQLLALVLCVGLLLHVSALGLAYAQAQSQWKEAPTSHGLVALAVQEWTPGSSLILVDFPGADRGDDDKDVLDPAWAHLRFDRRVRFEPPDFQPFDGDGFFMSPWGQPVSTAEGRWLYTFTGFDPERIDAITQHGLSQGQRVIVALYNTTGAHGDLAKAEEWARSYPGLGRRATDQVLWVLEPPDSPPGSGDSR